MSKQTNRSTSLHSRLLLIIIIPLIIIVIIAGFISHQESKKTSQTIYDNALITMAHVVARDVVINDGDLLGDDLLKTFSDTLGDKVFYHVIGDRAPALLSGYTPVPKKPNETLTEKEPYFFNAQFKGIPVRVVQFKEYFSNENYEGWVTTTTWQNSLKRDQLSFNLTLKTILFLILMLISTALTVWFGINYGLKPLLDLQNAIEKRSADDLSPIKRTIPYEVSKLVESMNNLFYKLESTFKEKDEFIANAAHQLRNPIAGLQSQAEAAERSKNPEKLKQRIHDIAEAARRTSRLTQQLLSMENISQRINNEEFETVEISKLVRDVLARTASRAIKKNIELSLDNNNPPIFINGNPILIGEVLDNLLDNALRYGCSNNGWITTKIDTEDDQVFIKIQDSGEGIPPEFIPQAFERFTRYADNHSDGSGLGLAIAKTIIEKHDGTLELQADETGTVFIIRLQIIKQD